MSADDLPSSVRRAEMTIAGVTLIVHNLDDGRRVIERERMEQLLEAMGTGFLTAEDAAALAKAVRS